MSQDVCVCVRVPYFQLSSGSKDAAAPLLTLYGIFQRHFCITDESLWPTKPPSNEKSRSKSWLDFGPSAPWSSKYFAHCNRGPCSPQWKSPDFFQWKKTCCLVYWWCIFANKLKWLFQAYYKCWQHVVATQTDSSPPLSIFWHFNFTYSRPYNIT